MLDWFLASWFSLSYWKSVSMILSVFTFPNACCTFFAELHRTFFVITSLSANFILCKLQVLHYCFLEYFRSNNDNTKWTLLNAKYLKNIWNKQDFFHILCLFQCKSHTAHRFTEEILSLDVTCCHRKSEIIFKLISVIIICVPHSDAFCLCNQQLT